MSIRKQFPDSEYIYSTCIYICSYKMAPPSNRFVVTESLISKYYLTLFGMFSGGGSPFGGI
jgi:hypothetical protein